jgi:hypothetical protein
MVRTAQVAFLATWALAALAVTGCKSPGTDTPQYWIKTFGGTDKDCGWSVQQTSDSGYIVAASMSSGVASTGWLIKTDPDGNKVWDMSFGGTEQGAWFYSVQQTFDGGYITVGYTNPEGADQADVLLVKTDASGNAVWDKTFGRTWTDRGRSVQQTLDGGFIIAGDGCQEGEFYTDVLLIKTDPDGNKVWDKTFGEFGRDEYCFSVRQTADSGYIVVSTTNPDGADSDVWLIKTDSNGNEMWQRILGWEGEEQGFRVQQTSDGGYVVVGFTDSRGVGERDILLIKTDAVGSEVWARTFGGKDIDYGRSVRQTSDGGYIITGAKGYSLDGHSDAWLIKTDGEGNRTWDMTFGGAEDDEGFSVQQTFDGGYVIAGQTYSYGPGANVILIKTEASGHNP